MEIEDDALLKDSNLNVLASCVTDAKNNVLKDSNTVKQARRNPMKKEACQNCVQNNCDNSCDKENRNGLKTPQKLNALSDPGTPTANLKMLVCAASVVDSEFSDVHEEKRRLFHETEIKTEFIENENEFIAVKQEKLKKGEPMGRKEKSLGLLCKKFMKIYPEHSESGTTILLDDVAKSLSIGRRRVYDIVNVLESMEMMVRQAKNKYMWFGKSRLPSTLTKLKALALRVYGPNFSHILKRYPNANTKNRESPTNSEIHDSVPVDALTNSIMDSIISYDQNRRDCNRSLGILCQKFIMLYMVAEGNVVTLDRAAKLLITEPDEGPGKYKTKVRRLYDIANILSSINFLEKTVSYEDATKKAAYKWVGIDLNTLNSAEETNKAFQSQEFSLTRHSLLSTVPRKTYLDAKRYQSSQLKFGCRSSSAHQLTSPGHPMQNSVKIPFPRTFSATNVTRRDEDCDDEDDVTSNEDGFDIEKWSTNTSPAQNEITEGKESPKEMLFQEKLRKLQEEFPDKLPDNGLLELLSACRKQQIKSSGRGLRRSLSSDFGQESDCVRPEKQQKLDAILQQNAKIAPKLNPDDNKKPSPVFYAALKPLLSYVPKSAGDDVANVTSNNQVKLTTTNTVQPNFQQAAYLTIPATFKQIHESTNGSSIVVSPISAPVTLAKNGYYQIIPVPCRSGNTKASMTIPPQLLNSPQATKTPPAITLKQQVLCNSNSSLTSPIPFIRAHLASPNTVYQSRCTGIQPSPKFQVAKGQLTQINQQQMMVENYSEFLTPPHTIVQNGIMKPPANPILFPKMTPETPSSAASASLMSAVTRKLMALHGEENA